jgi:hypothetical protein
VISARTVESSPARDRALSILHPTHPIASEEFAHYMWPLSPSWQRARKPGHGIRRKAASFLANLQREGLVESRSEDPGFAGYVVTPHGLRLASGWSLDAPIEPETLSLEAKRRASEQTFVRRSSSPPRRSPFTNGCSDLLGEGAIRTPRAPRRPSPSNWRLRPAFDVHR